MIPLNRCCITVTSVQFPTCKTHFSVSPCNLSSDNVQRGDITPQQSRILCLDGKVQRHASNSSSKLLEVKQKR